MIKILSFRTESVFTQNGIEHWIMGDMRVTKQVYTESFAGIVTDVQRYYRQITKKRLAKLIKQWGTDQHTVGFKQ